MYFLGILSRSRGLGSIAVHNRMRYVRVGSLQNSLEIPERLNRVRQLYRAILRAMDLNLAQLSICARSQVCRDKVVQKDTSSMTNKQDIKQQ